MVVSPSTAGRPPAGSDDPQLSLGPVELPDPLLFEQSADAPLVNPLTQQLCLPEDRRCVRGQRPCTEGCGERLASVRSDRISVLTLQRLDRGPTSGQVRLGPGQAKIEVQPLKRTVC